MSAAALLLLLAVPAAAADAGALRSGCSQELAKFCPKASSDGAVAACVKRNISRSGKECRAAFARIAAAEPGRFNPPPKAPAPEPRKGPYKPGGVRE